MFTLHTKFDTQEGRYYFPADFGFLVGNDKKIPDQWQSIKIMNIGLGSAKRIRAEWIIDADKLARGINEVAERASLDTRLKYVAGPVALEFEGKDWNKRYHFAGNQIVGHWNYLMPASFGEKGIDLVIPPFFIEACLFGLTANSKCAFADEVWQRLENLFKVDLVLSYLDIQNNAFKKSFKFDLQLMYSETRPANETDKDETSIFMLSFKETGTILPLQGTE